MDLFRRQVIDAQRLRLEGSVLLLPRWPHALAAFALLLWVGAAAYLLTQGHYSRKETLRGWLEPSGGLVQAYPLATGTLTELLVSPGQQVHRGDTLAIITGRRILRDGEPVETLLLQQLEADHSALSRELDRQNHRATLDLRALSKQLEEIDNTLGALTRQRSALTARHAMALSQRDRIQSLAGAGHVTQTELDRQEDERLRLQAHISALDVSVAEKAAERERLRAQRLRLPSDYASKRDELRRLLSEVEQKRTQLRANGSHVIEAPVDGTISRIAAKPGQQATPSTALFTLLPTASPLVLRLLVPVRAAGFLKQGQSLVIRYDAFPYQKFGSHQGHLTTVTDSALLPHEQRVLPVQSTEPVYQADGTPGQPLITAYGQEFALRAGMTFSADVQLEQRSVLEWLVEPLISLRGKLW